MGTVSSYWHRAHQMAWRETKDWVVGHPLAFGLAGVATTFGVLALWYFGSVDGLRDHAILLTAGMSTTVVSFVVLYLAHLIAIPPRWDRERRDDIRSLREEADKVAVAQSPVLSFELDQSDQRHSELVHLPGGRTRLFGRVALRNVAVGKSIQGVSVRLIEYGRVGAQQSTKANILLRCGAVDDAQVTIHGGGREFFDIVRAKTANEGGSIVFAPGGHERQVESGEYHIVLLAAGNDVVPVTITYLLRLEGGHVRMRQAGAESCTLV